MGVHGEKPVAVERDAAVETVSGSVAGIVFRNPESGYTVLRVAPPGDPQSLFRASETIVVGKTQTVWEGEEIRAEGRWVVDKTHGRQFKADSISCVPPRSIAGIEKYLASGIIKGVGKTLARRIVARFGEATLDVLDRQSARLEEIPKLGKAKVAAIRAAWRANAAMRENLIFGQTYGIGMAKMTKIVQRYGPDAIATIKGDPYQLCRDIWGIGFATADKIALSVGIPADSPLRARATIAYTLTTESESEGHCWTYENDLLLHANGLTGIPVETLSTALEKEIEERSVVAEADDAGGPRRIYLKTNYWDERDIARHVKRLLSAPAPFGPGRVRRAVEWWEARSGMSLAARQSVALERSLSSCYSIITGGPGVGKTTIIRALAQIHAAAGRRVVLAAPTGRAAKRMSEAVGFEAMTVHRLLKWNPATNRFTYDEENKCEGDVFIFDETSMIDVKLAANLLSALPDGATVVWVGDTDQLPSVGPGSVLGDLIKSGVVPSTRLDTIFRQDAGGLIVANAHHVNAGEPIETRRGGESDFYFLRCEDPEQCISRAIDFMANRIPAKFGMDPMRDVQVLVPMRRSALGTENLNQRLQAALNPTGDSIVRGGVSYRVGDRVMQLRNNYDKDVFNGDIGFIKAIDAGDRSMTVLFDGRPVRYQAADLDEIVLAYAMTIHKSQGSEYPAAIVIVHPQHYVMLQRNLLYTAITRGKKLVLLIGVPYAIDRAIQNNTVKERRTSLAGRLQAAFAIAKST
ncbi:MAG: ATP-dependent RecD-like DNA helicase [Kiritimatiellae bacterium]|nr:ATP-dependent RecD-like DNA helicase [Kiritimatiellia bacterium]